MSGGHHDERQASDPGSAWWGEHVARYRFAVERVRARRALDIACGTGYGLPIVADGARIVVGADRDATALREARRAARENAAVLATDATALPFRSGAFDVVTSFETIEHLPDRPAFVKELARVLSDDGVCLLSTPNAHYTRPIDGKPRNPFHLHEYRPEELRAELLSSFSSVSLLGQSLDRDRFVVSPFWDDQQRMPRSLARTAQLGLRRVLLRAPDRLRDRVSHLVWGHTFFPRPDDYSFSAETVGVAPVTVAICRKRAAVD
jgi:SAM-dependent methyltransferase